SSELKVGDFYASCMNEEKIEADGVSPLAPELERIDKIKDQRSLQAEIARLHAAGINALFRVESTQDAKNSAEVIAEVWQGGLGLPEGEYSSKPTISRKRSALPTLSTSRRCLSCWVTMQPKRRARRSR